MNKNLFKICFVIALTACAASAYGATIISSAPVSLGGGSYSPSNKVQVSVDTTANAYTAKAKHGSGDRLFATNNTDPKMWFKTVDVSSTVEASSTSDVLSTAAWTSM